jgi:release factor glutamine methyltransferase
VSAAATVDALLARARDLGVARLDAQLLVADRLGHDRAWLLAHGDAAVDATLEARLAGDFARRADGVPLAYLVGRREFHGLSLAITPAVLDPRPDTETLVDWALALALRDGGRAIDLGTGSGAIALALQQAAPRLEVWATDRSAAALEVARANAAALNLPVRFAHGDWWHAVEAGARFELALSNPPYIAADDPHLAGLRHEPREALTPGGDGLDAIRAIVEGAPPHLDAGAWLLLEHGFDQSEQVRRLLTARGFEAVESRHDLADRPRCSGGRWPADAARRRLPRIGGSFSQIASP